MKVAAMKGGLRILRMWGETTDAQILVLSGQEGEESESHLGIRGHAACGVTWREDFRCPGPDCARRKPQRPRLKPTAPRLPTAIFSAVP